MVDMSKTLRRWFHTNAQWSSMVFIGALCVASIALAAALAAQVPLFLICSVLVMPVVLWLVYDRPWMIGVALLGVTWGYLSELVVNVHKLPSINDILIPILIFAIALRRLAGNITLNTNITLWWFLGYIGFVSFGLISAPYPDRVEPVLIDLVKNLVIYLVLINLLVTTKAITRAAWVLILLGGVFGTITLFQEITGSQNNWQQVGGLVLWRVLNISEGIGDRPRASGPMWDPNVFGQQLVVILPFAIWAVINARRWWARAIAGHAVVAIIGGIALTYSRGSYLAVAIVICLMMVHIRLNPRYLVVLVPIIAAVLTFAPPDVRSRFLTLQELFPDQNAPSQEISDYSLERRSIEMTMAARMFLDHPLNGVGADNFVMLYPVYIRESGAPVGDEYRNAHSLYLEVAAEGGMIGMTFLFGTMILALRELRRAEQMYRVLGEPAIADLANAAYLGFIGYLITAIFIHGDFPRFLWLQIAFAAAFSIAAQNRAMLRMQQAAAQHNTGGQNLQLQDAQL
jgi:O-antigen ligase